MDATCEPSGEDAGDCDTEPTGSHRPLGFQRGMAIASLNINGLRSHHDEINWLLNDKGIHVLVPNETKLDGSVPKELTEISGYQQQRLDRTCNGGGVFSCFSLKPSSEPCIRMFFYSALADTVIYIYVYAWL